MPQQSTNSLLTKEASRGNESEKKAELDELWKHVKEKHLGKLKKAKEDELKEKKRKLVYKTGTEKAGSLIKEEPAMDLVESFLDFDGKNDKVKERAGKWVDDDKLEELWLIKEKLTKLEELEELKKVEEDAPEIKHEKIKNIRFVLETSLELDKENEEVKEDIERLEKFTEKVKKAPNIPSILVKKDAPEEENYDNYIDWKSYIDDELKGEKRKKFNKVYEIIHPNEDRLVKKEIARTSKITQDKFPNKLYDIKEKKIKTKDEINKKSITYATLSYVCKDDDERCKKWEIGSESFELSPSSTKSLAKAIVACQSLENIDYLWMDKLCIDQSNDKEKAEEVRNMYRNYNNSAITLIAIHKKINDGGSSQRDWDHNPLEVLKKIINSEWFSRSWTFQEGWLSKRTLFMFDDMLIDGAFLAQVWAFNQSADAEGKYDSHKEFEEREKKIATPIGWVRCKGGYELEEDRLTFRLYEALRGVRERKRGVSIDGIYTILGLLPYGDRVEVSYKNWGHRYTQEELQKALMKVMKAAAEYKDKKGDEYGHGEPLAWHGLESGTEGRSWLPKISESGSTEVWGGINIYCESGSLVLDVDNGIIKFDAKKYYIDGEIKDMTGIGGKNILEGTYLGKISVEGGKEIKVWGTKEAIEKARQGNYLLVTDKDKFKSSLPFAILVSRKGGDYEKMGLVELDEEGRKKLEEVRGINSELITVNLNKGTIETSVPKLSQEPLELSNLKKQLEFKQKEIKQLEVRIKELESNDNDNRQEIFQLKIQFDKERQKNQQEKVNLQEEQSKLQKQLVKSQLEGGLYRLISEVKNKLGRDKSLLLDGWLEILKEATKDNSSSSGSDKIIRSKEKELTTDTTVMKNKGELSTEEIKEIRELQTQILQLPK